MKYDLLEHLKEYKELLEEKFGINNINVDDDNYHNKIDSNNSINYYLRERLGNLNIDLIEYSNYVTKYNLKNNQDFSNNYLLEIYKKSDYNPNSFIELAFSDLRSYFLKLDSDNGADKHLLYGDADEIIYIKFAKNYDYLLIEMLEFGKKVDVKSISSKYYDGTTLKYLISSYLNNQYIKENARNVIKYVLDKIDEQKILPEIEFVSKIYENDLKIIEIKFEHRLIEIPYTKNVYDNNFEIYEYNGKISEYLKNVSNLNIIFKHFDLIRKNNELLLDRLNLLDDITCCEKNSSKRRVRKF